MSRNNKTGARYGIRRLLLSLIVILTALTVPRDEVSSSSSATVNSMVRINSTTIIRGQTSTVTVDLTTVGVNENTVGFSIDFDVAQLSFVSATPGTSGAILFVQTSLLASGKLGLGASIGAAPAVFATGTHQIAVITFTALNTGTLSPTTLTFGDSPVPRELISVTPLPLPVDFQTGAVTIPTTSPFESDVAPRPTGSATVVVSDWVQVGRFSVSLDSAADGTEFQRADCAPRASSGDGRITVADWVQAGRYSVALDTLSAVGGPAIPSSFTQTSTNNLGPLDQADGAGKRIVRAVSGMSDDQSAEIHVEIEAQGNENALGFTLRFDPQELELMGPVSIGPGATAARLLVNDWRAADGFVAIALALPAGRTLSVAKHRLLSLRFVQRRGQERRSTHVWFDDSVIDREVVNANAEPLQFVSYSPSRPSTEGSALAAARNPNRR